MPLFRTTREDLGVLIVVPYQRPGCQPAPDSCTGDCPAACHCIEEFVTHPRLEPTYQVILPDLQVLNGDKKPVSPTLEALFGNRTAAWTLLFLQAYGEAYAKSVADTFQISVNLVQSQLKRLEESGLLVSRTIGRTRLFTWNPSSPSARDLQSFLQSELERLPKDITQQYFRQRRRPRRTGKPN